MRSKITIIIPAAGQAKRLRTSEPRSILEIGKGITLLGYQVSTLRGVYGDSAEIILVVGYSADRVIQEVPPGVKVVENEGYVESNVSRSIGMALRVASHERVVIVYGDLAFNKEVFTGLTSNGSAVIAGDATYTNLTEVGIARDGSHVANFAFGLPQKWSQITYLTGSELGHCKAITEARANSHLLGFEVMNKVLERGGTLRAVTPPSMRVVEIDTRDDLQRARQLCGC